MRLPVTYEIMQEILRFKENEKLFLKDVIRIAAKNVMEIWISLNVYTKSQSRIVVDIEQLYKSYEELKRYPRKKKGTSYWLKFKDFSDNSKILFNILGNDDVIKSKKKV
jgi:hypothetical protein